jgi:TetR/AcrR family transcriptional regulator, transcriptional repressor for nem operon
MAIKGVETKQKIIEESLKLFSIKGYYHTSIQDILEATHLTKGGLYGHFKNKEAIWQASYDQAAQMWKSIVLKNLENMEDPLERIEKALDNDLRYYLGGDVFPGGCFFLNMLVELSGQSKTMADCTLKGMMGFSKVLTQWLKEAHQKKMLKPDFDCDEVSKFIIVSISGCAALYASSHDSQIWKLTLSQLKQYINGLKK